MSKTPAEINNPNCDDYFWQLINNNPEDYLFERSPNPICDDWFNIICDNNNYDWSMEGLWEYDY